MEAHRVPKVGHRSIKGAEPRERRVSTVDNPDSVAPPGLPRNFYNNDWVKGLTAKQLRMLDLKEVDYDFERGGFIKPPPSNTSQPSNSRKATTPMTSLGDQSSANARHPNSSTNPPPSSHPPNIDTPRGSSGPATPHKLPVSSTSTQFSADTQYPTPPRSSTNTPSCSTSKGQSIAPRSARAMLQQSTQAQLFPDRDTNSQSSAQSTYSERNLSMFRGSRWKGKERTVSVEDFTDEINAIPDEEDSDL